MPRKITASELLELAGDGAKVSKTDKPLVVEGLQSILQAICEMAEQSRAQAEDQRLALLEAVNQISDAIASQCTDMEPVRAALMKVADIAKPRERANYHFTIERGPDGLIKSISATPEAPERILQ